MGGHGRATGASWPTGGGELGALIRAHNWAATPLGPVDRWPESLRAAVGLILNAPQPLWLGWGPALIAIYNDAYATLLDDERHPALLGRPTAEGWADIWPLIGPDLQAILAGGPAVTHADRPVPHRRGGAVRDLHFTYSYSPIPDPATPHGVGGVLCLTVETTGAVAHRAGREREAFLLRLADALRPLADPVAIQAEAARVLGRHLGASRASYAEVAADGVHFAIHRDYTDGVPSFAGRYRLDSFGPRFVADLRAGRTATLADAARDARVGAGERATLAAGAIRAFIGVPLVKGGRLAAILSLHHPAPRAWPADEVALVEEVAERTWAAVERARAEAALRQSEARFRGFAEASADTLWIVDAATGQLAYLSPAFAALFGAPRETIARDLATWGALVHPDDRGAATRALPRALAGEIAVTEYRIVRPTDGATRWVRDTGFPIRDDAGAVAFVGGIARDITDQRRAEADRERLYQAEREARALAEATVRGRDEFLATAAHELRAPLARLRLGSQLLQLDGALDAAERADTLASIERASGRFEMLVRDLVDLARVRTGQLTLAVGPVKLGTVARDAVAEARQRDGGRHRFRLTVPVGLPPVLADPGRIMQVLANLLDNAAAYSPPGTTIAVAARRDGAGVVLAVQDRGQGLAPGEAAAIFAPFARSASAVMGQQPGLGLGLAIARGIVERHGGWIRATSAGEGRGATVTAWLPVAGPPGSDAGRYDR